MAQKDVDLLRPFFIKLENFESIDSVIYFHVDVVSQDVQVTLNRRYSDFLELNNAISSSNGGVLPDWYPHFPGKMLKMVSFDFRLIERMHQLEHWLSELMKYCKSVEQPEEIDFKVAGELIKFLEIEKIWQENQVEFSKSYNQKTLKSKPSFRRSESTDANIYSLIKSGEIDEIELRLNFLIKAKGKIAVFHDKDSKGETLLHVAAAIDRQDVVILLLDLGADINFTSDKFEDTALHFACIEVNIDVAKILVSRGADVNAQNSTGKTPLHYAARFSFDLVKFLLEHGADYLTKSDDMQTALHISCHDCVEAASYLLTIVTETALGISGRDNRGHTPFLCAVAGGSTHNDASRLALIQQLIAMGSDIFATDNSGLNAIHLCCTTDDKGLALLLIAKGVPVEALDHKNRNALQIAVQNGSEEMVYFLMKECDEPVSPFHLDDSGENSLHIAAATAPDSGVFELVWEEFKNIDNLDQLDVPNMMGYTPLHIACMSGRKEAVTALVAAGASLTIKTEVIINNLKRSIISVSNGLCICSWLLDGTNSSGPAE